MTMNINGVELNQPDGGSLGGASRRGRRGTREEPLKVQLERRRMLLNQDRLSWYPLWQDIADHFLPFRNRFLQDQYQTNKGYKRNYRLVDSTPLKANNTAAAGIFAGVTSPSRPWFKYSVENEDLLEAQGVKAWLDLITKKARSILNNSNFYDAIFECYREFSPFGIMALGREWDIAEKIPHFQAFAIGSYYIGNDDNRRVNVFFREFQWTVQQIVDRFVDGPLEKDESWSNISDTVRSMWENQQYDVMINLVHAITENIDRKKGPSGNYRLDASGMRFRSVYYEQGGDPERILKNSEDDKRENRKALRVKGWRDFPVFIGRWYTNSEDAWARGPGTDCLGDAKSLQFQQKRKAQAIDKLVDPPMKAHPSLRNQRTSMLPGDVTYIAPEQGQVGFEPVYPNYKPDIQALLEDIRESQERIEQVMGVKLFANFIDDAEESRQPITAAQVNVEQQEKLILLGPVLQNTNNGVLNPLMHWLLDQMLKQGEVPPPPDALKKGDIKIEYSSMIAQAIQQIEAGSLQQLMGFVGSVAQLSAQGAQNPALDKLDFDEAIEQYANAVGAPATVVRSDADVEQIRKVRQQQQDQQAAQEQQAATAQAALAHSGAVNNLANSPMGQGSVLDSAVGAAPVAG